MTVDKGGLEYTIEVRNLFSGPLETFRSQLSKSSRAFQEFKNAARGLSTATAKQAAAIRQQTTAQRASNSVNARAQAQASRRQQQIGIREAAERRLTAIVRRRAIQARVVQLADQRGLDLTLKATAAQRAQSAVQNRLRAATDRLALAQATARSTNLRQLTVEAEVLKRVEAAERRRLVTAQLAAQGLDAQGNRRVAQLTVEAEVTQRIERAERRRLVTSALAAQGRRASGDREIRQLTIIEEANRRAAAAERRRLITQELATRGLDAQGAALKRTRSDASRLLFTFRRLFGVLALFTAVRFAGQGIANVVRQMVRFNATLETANLGLASIITATGDVRDAVGNAVGASERLALAQREAGRQTQLLRRDGLQTAATFEQLVDTFQIAVGPGLAAGLDLDQIRRFTVQVSQAASAAGVAQNQLSEEIRSILSGTIQQRTTRLAAVLGITNEDIRRAKEAGVLVEFLQERFSAFSEAGEVALGTFAALITNVQDALLQLLGAGGLQFFDELKGLLRDVQDLATDIDPITGVLQPSPQAEALVRGLADGLQAAVAEARRLGEAFGFDDVKQSAQLLGAVLGGTARFLGQIFEGFVKGTNDIAAIVNGISDKFQELTGITLFSGDTVATIVRVATLLGGIFLLVRSIAITSGLIATAWAFVANPMGIVASLASRLLVTITAIRTATLSTVAAAAALPVLLFTVAEVTRRIVASVTGIELGWIAIARIVRNEVAAAISELAVIGEAAWEIIKTSAEVTFLQVQVVLTRIIRNFQRDAVAIISRLSSVAGIAATLAFAAVTQTEEALQREIRARQNAHNLALQQLNVERQRIKAQRDAANTQALIDDAAGTGTLGDVIGEFLAPAIEGVNAVLDGLGAALGSELSVGVLQAEVEFRNLNAIIDNLAPSLSSNSAALAAQEDLTRSIAENTAESRNDLELATRTLGAGGAILQQRQTIIRAEQELRARTTGLIREESNIVLQIAQVEVRRRRAGERIAALSGVNRVVLDEAVRLGQEILSIL